MTKSWAMIEICHSHDYCVLDEDFVLF